ARVPANGDNYTAINEAEANGETDYIESTGDGARARFGLTNPSLAHDPIFVVPYAVARKTEAGTDDLILRLHKGGQQDDGEPVQVDFPSFQSIGRWAPLDPSTGNPWTREGIEGVDLNWSTREAREPVRCHQGRRLSLRRGDEADPGHEGGNPRIRYP